MRLISAENSRRRHQLYLPSYVVLLLAAGSTGCNTCFSFTSNPPTGTIGIKAGDPQPACTLTKATGAIRLAVQTIPMCSACPESSRILHLVVSIRGIDVHGSATAGNDSPDWQELAPQFATQPLQVDLVGGAANRGTRERLGGIVAVPVGLYHQVRVRFAPNVPTTEDRLPENNVCGNAGFNCVVMADGTVQPLLFDSGSPELHITSERIVGGALLVLPDIDSDLVIEMKPVWSWAWASSVNRDIRLLPALTGNARVEQVESDELGTAGQTEEKPRMPE